MLYDKIIIENKENPLTPLIDVDSINAIHKALKISKPVIYYFHTDEEVRSVNKASLNHDYYTDVITFDYEQDIDIEENEVIISWERVMDNAINLKQPTKREIHRVCIHALLHLAGYNDATQEEIKEMRKQEEHFLSIYCST